MEERLDSKVLCEESSNGDNLECLLLNWPSRKKHFVVWSVPEVFASDWEHENPPLIMIKMAFRDEGS